jgi:quercetin dioxygenase-like cupin family protein
MSNLGKIPPEGPDAGWKPGDPGAWINKGAGWIWDSNWQEEKEEPSIKLEHKDARGEIYSIALPGNREVMLLHSKAGTLRGGHSHSCDEDVVLISGQMRYYKLVNGVEQITEMRDGDVSFNPAGLVHMGGFDADSWVLEVKLAKKDAWTQEDYEPMRAKVRASAA